jgi:hypothetical protein
MKFEIIFTAHKNIFRIPKDKPKKPTIYFMLNNRGRVVTAPFSASKSPERIAWGNCFKTEEQAKEAKQRISKFFKRINKYVK